MQQDLLESSNRHIYSVGELNRLVRRQLETGVGKIWLEGEISNLSRPGSGHLYFSLKDEQAQVRCAMFRSAQRTLDFVPENGQQIVAFARVSLYEARGEYQLVVEQIEEVGAGLLRREFERLKQKLQSEGLFDSERKQPLPSVPRTIGIVTSTTAAALQDVIRVVTRRAPWIRLIVFPSRVQGENAGAELTRAVRKAEDSGLCDLILLVRGGGSLEDLWAFNDEKLARAIAECETPLVSGVGHETDFTIADFVADLRGPTPSAAAELATPDGEELQQSVARLQQRLLTQQRARIRAAELALRAMLHRLRLQHPLHQLEQRQQRRDELAARLLRAHRQHTSNAQNRLTHAVERLRTSGPSRRLPIARTRLEHVQHRLHSVVDSTLARLDSRLKSAARALDAVSPLATLGRGYAIVQRADTANSAVTDAAQVAPGDAVYARLARGSLLCRIEQTSDETLSTTTGKDAHDAD